MKKMRLGEQIVTVLQETKQRILFETEEGDKFVARRRFLTPLGEKHETA